MRSIEEDAGYQEMVRQQLVFIHWLIWNLKANWR